MATGQLGQYLDRAATTKDRWASALRCASARAAAAGTQRRIVDANALVDQAVGVDSGFAGYAVTHVLSLASRYCELGNSGRIGALGLFDRARNRARRVRDPRFGAERAELVNQFEQWLASPTPAWQMSSQSFASHLMRICGGRSRISCRRAGRLKGGVKTGAGSWSPRSPTRLRSTRCWGVCLVAPSGGTTLVRVNSQRPRWPSNGHLRHGHRHELSIGSWRPPYA